MDRIEKSASPVESTSGGPLNRNSTGQVGNRRKMGRYNGDAWNIPRKIMLHHEMPGIKRQIALTWGFEGSAIG
ncbi:MAG: hypothetical protein DSY90_09160 [Deltaproteobacteria bacterium]|nr:MAG: hypothetical protein DSY90_09160 [Deltaproteobacteria bacterium]